MSFSWASFFLLSTLAVGLLDFEVDVVLARLEADFSDQPPTIPAVLNHQVSLQCQPPSTPAMPNCQVSLQCPTTKYPCSAQPQSILTLPNRKASLQCSTTKYPRSAQPQNIPAVPNCKVSLQCPTTKYPCSAQLPSIPAVPNRRVSLHCRTAKHPCSAQPLSILAVPNRKISLQCPTAKYPCTAQPQSILGVPNSRVSIFLQRICSAARKTVEGGRETLHFLCNNGFRVGMLEVTMFFVGSSASFWEYQFLGLRFSLKVLMESSRCSIKNLRLRVYQHQPGYGNVSSLKVRHGP